MSQRSQNQPFPPSRRKADISERALAMRPQPRNVDRLPRASTTYDQLSRTCRTLLASWSNVKGFWRNSVPASRTPLCTTALRV